MTDIGVKGKGYILIYTLPADVGDLKFFVNCLY